MKYYNNIRDTYQLLKEFGAAQKSVDKLDDNKYHTVRISEKSLLLLRHLAEIGICDIKSYKNYHETI